MDVKVWYELINGSIAEPFEVICSSCGPVAEIYDEWLAQEKADHHFVYHLSDEYDG